MYDSILVPTDGSEAAETATQHALSLAATFEADIHALRAIDLQKAAGPFDAGGLEKQFVERLRSQAKEDVQHIADQWAKPDRFHEAVEEGAPSKVVLEYIDEHDVDLVAMGTHGRSGLKRFVLGSVAEHVLRASPVPVLVAHAVEDEPTLPYEDVLVPTDGSECAAGAVDHAFSIAEACDATLHAVNVVDEAAMGSPGGALPSNYLESLESMGEEALESIEHRARDAGIDCETAVRQDRPGKGIEAYAEENDVGLVVMGTHGRSGVERFLLGSTTEHVIRNGGFPVLGVPSTEPVEE